MTLHKEINQMTGLRKSLSIMALAAVVSAPLLFASGDADAASCRTRKLNGTLLGAAGGRLLGDAVTHGSTGPIVGGLGGAVVGREIGRNGCDRNGVAYRGSRARPAHYHSSAAHHAPVRQTSRKVYYDAHGAPISYVDADR